MAESKRGGAVGVTVQEFAMPMSEELLQRLMQGGLMGSTPIIADDAVQFGPSFTIPEGMTYERAGEILKRKQEEEESETEFSREFMYRPMDGANATIAAMKEMFGITLGKTIHSFFGSQPPELRRVAVGPTETVQVPWGRMEIPTMEGMLLQTGSKRHNDYGEIYVLLARGKRKYRTQAEALFDLIEEKLKVGSIYRGKAITGLEEPGFLDLSEFDPESVVYAGRARTELDSSLWSVLRYTDAMRRDKLTRKRAVLLYGPYGTGKTLTGQLTAKIATDNGWTFIAARPGRDDLEDVMRMARLYEPCVVFFEDVDNATSTDDDDEVSELLDVFDGITAKGGELVVVMTTNHIERIHKGMLRPGRLDALIEIEALDREGVEKLIRQSVGQTKLDSGIDFDAVAEAMEGFYPAFISEAINRATAVALARVDGKPQYNLTTSDLETAALSLRPQLEVMQRAEEGEHSPALDSALRNAVETAVHGTGVVDGDGDRMFSLAVNGRGGDE